MHRKPLIEDLKAYRARWMEEQDVSDRFLAFVEGHHQCFERALQIGHVTGAGWIEDASRRQVLLLHHRKLDRWLQPGGHADGDPDVLAVALKEVEEETGLTDLQVEGEIFDLDIHPIPARGDEPEHLHYDVRYRVQTRPGARPRANHESLELRWFPIEEVASWQDIPSLSRMAIKSLNRR